jgi:hypothetical protein
MGHRTDGGKHTLAFRAYLILSIAMTEWVAAATEEDESKETKAKEG